MVGKNLYIFAGLIFLLVLISHPPSVDATYSKPYTHSQSTTYTLHEAIDIDNNEDLEAQGWPGDGTPETPYLIEGLNITVEYGTCISVYGVDAYLLIQNCHLYSERSIAIGISNTNNCIVENNVLTDIRLYGAIDCTILSNTLPDGNIYLSSSYNATVVNNTIGSNLWFSGSTIQHWIQNISDNHACGLPIGYFIDAVSEIIYAEYYGTVILVNCTDTVITGGYTDEKPSALQLGFCKNCTVSDNINSLVSLHYSEECTVRNNSVRSNETTGIALSSCNQITVQENNIYSNEINGIGVFESTNCIVDQNNVSGYTGYIASGSSGNIRHVGVCLSGSKNCSVTDNILHGNPSSGIYSIWSLGLVISGNYAHNNSGCGIEIFGAHGTIVDNELVSNNGPGIGLKYYENSTITGNVLSDNGGGIIAEYHSYNTTIENNDITDNKIGIELEESQSFRIINNTLHKTGLSIIPGFYYFSEQLTIDDYNHIIENNTLDGAPIGYWWGIVSASIDLTGYGQAIIVNSTSLIISGGQFSKSGVIIAFCNDSLIENMSVENCVNYGLTIMYCVDFEINGCSFISNGIGVSIGASQNCQVYDSLINSNSYGLSIYNSEMITVSSNNLENNLEHGLTLTYSLSCSVSDNIFLGSGVALVGGSTHWTHEFENNLVNEEPLGYFKELSDITLDIENYGAIILASCHGVDVEGGTFYNTSIGIQMGYCSDCVISGTHSSNNTIAGVRSIGSPGCTIIDSHFNNNEFGVEIGSTMGEWDGVSIVNCVITENNYGVSATYDDNLTILDSIISENKYDGVRLYYSEGCHIENSIVSKNGRDGVSGWYMTDNAKFIANEISENGEFGISGFDSYSEAVDNQICYNGLGGIAAHGIDLKFVDNQIVANNGTGISAYYFSSCTILDNFVCNNTGFGIKLDYWGSDETVNNTICGNSLGWNVAGNALDTGPGTYWDNGITGNYWSDYNGSGVYHIPGTAGSIDRYPSILLSFQGDTTHPTTTISDLTDTPNSFLTSLIMAVVGIEIVLAVVILWYSKIYKKH